MRYTNAIKEVIQREIKPKKYIQTKNKCMEEGTKIKRTQKKKKNTNVSYHKENKRKKYKHKSKNTITTHSKI